MTNAKEALGRSGLLQALLLVLLLVTGCDDSGRRGSQVSGKVVYQGKALPSEKITWTVIFVSSNDQKTSAVVGKDGTYTADNVPAGPTRIAVVGAPSVPGGLVPHGQPRLQLSDASQRLLSSLKKFQSPDQSGLTYTVTKGNQRHDIELIPE
jgi:hypothetical protein